MNTILVIDDEPGIREVLHDILSDEGYQVMSAEDGVEGLSKLKQSVVDLVILDVWLPKMGGIEVLETIRAEYPEVEVLIISGHANVDMAVKAIKLGAFDMMEKPLSMERVLTLVRNAMTIEQLRRENRKLKQGLGAPTQMLGEDAKIKEIRTLIAQSAPTNATVFISGENGTGKELVARQIHEHSPRAKGPFVPVNCAAIPDPLFESELFGHEKGSFTGAISRKRGKFELAQNGTLFLDEIADLSLPAQAKILRAIQELKIERVGGEETIELDLRIIAASNKDMKELIAQGLFREDLFYRLHVVPIHVPSLRERREDIAILARHFLSEFQLQLLGEQGRIGGFTEAAMLKLQSFHWPGNIRQFRNVIQRIVVFADAGEVGPDDVDAALAEEKKDQNKGKQGTTGLVEFFGMGLNEARDQFERRYILHKLEETDFNITRAATAMGLYPSNLHGKMKKFGIERQKEQ